MFGPQQPFDVRKINQVYYGWIVLAAGTLGMLAAVPGSPPGMSAFADPMMEELDLSRDFFALAYTLGTICAGLGAPFAGRYVDRYGSRPVMVIGYLAIGLILVYTGLVDRIYRYLAGGQQVALLGFFLVFFAFFGMRLFGVSVAMTACRSMVFRWFGKYRGIAASINGSMMALSFSSAPVVMNWIASGIGWRPTWIVVGVVFALIFSVLAYIFFRESPEACGLPIDGIDPDAATDEDGTPALGRNVLPPDDYTVGEAMRTLPFWLFVGALALNALIGTGLAFHMVAIGEAFDIGKDEILTIFAHLAVFNIITMIAFGWLSERIELRYILVAMLATQAASLVGVLRLDDPFHWWLFAVGGGIGWGCFGLLVSTPWPRFYGRKHLGEINGVISSTTIVMSALGPYVFGLAQTQTGSFAPAVMTCLAICPLLMLAGLLAVNPQRKATS